MGIIKTLASEITSFDIFSGIGISAATAFAQAAKSSYDFEKEFRKNMLEVATISTQVTDDMTGFMNQVMSITQEIPIKAPEAVDSTYRIGNRSFIVEPVFKEESSQTLGEVLLRLMKSESEKL